MYIENTRSNKHLKARTTALCVCDALGNKCTIKSIVNVTFC